MSRTSLLCPALLLVALSSAKSGPAVVDGITFFDKPNEVVVPVREAGKLLDWRVDIDAKTHALKLNGQPIKASMTRQLFDGTLLVSLQALKQGGATVNWNEARGSAGQERP